MLVEELEITADSNIAMGIAICINIIGGILKGIPP